MWFSQTELFEIETLAAAANLDAPERRPLLLAGIHTTWARGLPDRAARDVQLASDLQLLNTAGPLDDGSVPLLTWLTNAVRRAAPHTEAAELAGFRDQLASKLDTAPPARLAAPAAGKEIVIHDPDFLPVGFLADGERLARAVARVEVPRVIEGVAKTVAGGPELGLGTGFLVAPGLLLTNHHVVAARREGEPDPTDADWKAQVAGTRVRFDYDSAANLDGTTTVAVAKLLAADKALDYALLELSTADRDRGWFHEDLAPKADTPANIIQHPGGREKQIAVRNNLVHRVEPETIQYFTDTEGGSSGSPVCGDDWRVLALHRSWRVVHTRFQGKSTAYINEGTPLAAIVAHLGPTWSEAVATARAGGA